MHIAQVAVPGPFWQGLDYLIPDGIDIQCLIGCRVQVPLGRRQVIGLVLALSTESEYPHNKLRQIHARLDEKPIFPDAMWRMLPWMARYYHAPIGDVIHTALPARLCQGKAWLAPVSRIWQLTELGQQQSPTKLSRAPKQAKVLALLKQPMPHSELLAQGVNSTTLKAMQKKGWLICEAKEPEVASTAHQNTDTQPPTLNPEQQVACESIISALGHFKAFLLFGVTGSGKTEVYLRAIDAVLCQDKQALVLVPEIGLTPQTVARFKARFNVPIYVLHSHMTDVQRAEQWWLAKQGHPCVVIGTRSALFTPLPSLGLIIIDEEHDQSYKQQTGVRYSARDMGIRLAQLSNIPIVLGSATPSLESWHNAKQARYQMLTLNQKALTQTPLKMHIISMHQQHRQAGLSQPLIEQIQQHLSQNGQVLLFLNRRGFAPVLFCGECGWSAECHRCDAKMTLHLNPPHLACHRCGHQQPVPTSCPECHTSVPLQQVGTGTERLANQLAQQFPQRHIVRLDRDTTSQKGELEANLKAIHQQQADIIIGTQMIAKGHHFEHVTMVGVVDMDAALFSQDFRALEHMSQLLLQVAGRTGRTERTGEVYIQTSQPKHWALQLLLKEGYAALADALCQERQEADWPPYAHAALLVAEAKQAAPAEAFLMRLRRQLDQLNDSSLIVYGPVAAIQQKRAGFYRFQLLLQSASKAQLQHGLKKLSIMLQQNTVRNVRWFLDIDPIVI